MNQSEELKAIKNYQNGDTKTKQAASNKLWKNHSQWIGKVVEKRMKHKSVLNEDEMLSVAYLYSNMHLSFVAPKKLNNVTFQTKKLYCE